jgi:Ca-activated chloride channel homolog
VGNLYRDDELLKQADALEIQAEKIEDQGMSPKNRKVLRTESYQMKNQQLSQ